MLMFSKATLKFIYLTSQIMWHDWKRQNKFSLNIKYGHGSRNLTISYICSHIKSHMSTAQSNCRVPPLPCSFVLWYPYSTAIYFQVERKNITGVCKMVSTFGD